MARNTSILLGDYFENFINEQIASGKYSSVSEVVRTALRMFEHEETKKKELIKELKLGEKSPKVKDFDRDKFLEQLKAIKNKIKFKGNEHIIIRLDEKNQIDGAIYETVKGIVPECWFKNGRILKINRIKRQHNI